MKRTVLILVVGVALLSNMVGAAEPPAYRDPAAKRYDLSARASQVDARAKAHPEFVFVFE
jgi:hypothetical protein